VLDVGVALFDPGISELNDDEPVYPEVRRAEATFIAKELSKTLQEVGVWGAVRVVPDDQQFTDVLVSGTILHSDGEKLTLQVNVTDARGVTWINKTYSGTTSKYAYEGRTAGHKDPFLMVYRNIANDMLALFQGLSSKERLAVRQVAELRFARNFAADAFEDYLSIDKRGQYQIVRLPAENDPMLERVRSIRERDLLFVDTLQEYYDGFNGQMQDPYQEWRKLTYEVFEVWHPAMALEEKTAILDALLAERPEA
jgi:hypothetical protein